MRIVRFIMIVKYLGTCDSLDLRVTQLKSVVKFAGQCPKRSIFELSEVTESERDTFYLTMLASIEVGHHKGNDVLVQAMNKVLRH